MQEFLPGKMEQLNLIIGGSAGAILGYIFHGLPTAIYWLIIFVLVDYVTGLWQAIVNKNLSSKIGFKGIIKKVVIMSVVILFHGISEIVEMPSLDTAVIFAFSLNELCSIIENIERAGFGDIFPPAIRQILQICEDKEKEVLNKLDK